MELLLLEHVYEHQIFHKNYFDENDKTVSIYPNPSSSDIFLRSSENILKVELYDASGKLLKTTTIYPGSTIAYFDVQTLYAGVYLIKITDDFKSITKKVIIKRD